MNETKQEIVSTFGCLLLIPNVQLIRHFRNCFQAEIISKATSSVRSPIKNLADVNKDVNVQQLLTAIGYEFLRTPAEKLTDGGREQVMQQRGFQLINPTEKWFPGLNETRETFASWDWRYGKTPKFSVQKNIQLKSGEDSHDLKLNVEVEKVKRSEHRHRTSSDRRLLYF